MSTPEATPRCRVYKEPCPVHDFIHGAEAEGLREGIEKLISDDGDVSAWSLRSLLDRVDARDSLAYREATRRDRKARR